MDSLHKQEFRVRDLSTRSVTLFPTRAQVVREIKDVPLKPGANQITIVGLTPTVDEDSIKVEGTGAAIITDIAVELLPNREIFEDIYPDSDDDKSDDGSDSEEEEADKKVGPQLKAVRDKLRGLRDEQNRAKEVLGSAASRLKILDAYGSTMNNPKRGVVEIESGLEKYRAEREKVFKDHMEGTLRDRELQDEILELVKEEAKLFRLDQKAEVKAAKVKAKAKKAKEKVKEQERRREAEKLKEKRRIRKERESFWPRQCYTVRISLDVASSLTPASSRRSSIAGDIVKMVSEKETTTPTPPEAGAAASDAGQPTCDLSLSYVTSSAFWAPSYDLALSTMANTGLLCFDAQLTNMTSESWNNCKVILSTSQTTFSGLKDAIPVLVPWHLKLGPRGTAYSDVLNSREERAEKEGWTAQQNVWAQTQKPRGQLFGPVNEANAVAAVNVLSNKVAADPFNQTIGKAAASYMPYQAQSMYPQAPRAQAPIAQTALPRASLFGNAGPSHHGGIPPPAAADKRYYRESSDRKKTRSVGGGLFGFGGSGGGGARRDSSSVAEEDEEIEADGDDGATMLPEPVPELSFQESSFEETGLTTTYDLPGLKSLVPSSSGSKQRVARVTFSSVAFSHTVVAKYKPVAFLKVKVRNASKLTLLKGRVGLTLDGSFMGRSTLPRCSAGDHFTLSLGVDPAIKVAYPKPEVKRSTLGLFSKEDNSVYTRSVTLINTRNGAGAKPVTIVVYDQAPISEDEKLRVEVLQPKGLSGTIGGVPAGVPGRETVKDDKDWGKATAVLRKAGEVTWDVSLNPGRSVKLVLEYEVACPTGEKVVQC